MARMSRVLFALLTGLWATTAHAVDYRWTRGFAMGTHEAIIRNAGDASLNIYCPSGQVDKTPGIFIETRKLPLKLKEKVLVQMVVDGKNHPFYFEGDHYLAAGRAFRQSLDELVSALNKAK